MHGLIISVRLMLGLELAVCVLIRLRCASPVFTGLVEAVGHQCTASLWRTSKNSTERPWSALTSTPGLDICSRVNMHACTYIVCVCVCTYSTESHVCLSFEGESGKKCLTEDVDYSL